MIAFTMRTVFFTLDGGFWAVVSETILPGSPELTIRHLSVGSVQICWPSSKTAFGLQQTASLGASVWSPLTPLPTDDGTRDSPTGGGKPIIPAGEISVARLRGTLRGSRAGETGRAGLNRP